MRGRKLGVAAFAILMVGMIAPMALAGDSHSDVFTFTTLSNNGTRVISIHTPPAFSAIDLFTSGGTVASTTPGTTTVAEVNAAGANWAVTAQVCGPTNETTVDSATAISANSADCATGSGHYGNQFAGYNTSTHAFQTTIAGSRVTAASSVTNSGTGLLSGTSVSATPSSLMTTPVTVLSASEISTSSYTSTYASTTSLSIPNVTDNATWVGYWVTTLTP